MSNVMLFLTFDGTLSSFYLSMSALRLVTSVAMLNSKLFMFEVVNHHHRHLLALHSHVVMHRNTKNNFIMWKCFPLRADSPGSPNRTSPSPHFFIKATNVPRTPMRTTLVTDRRDATNALP